MLEHSSTVIILLSKRDEEVEKLCESYGMLNLHYPTVIDNTLIGRKFHMRLVLTPKNSVALFEDLLPLLENIYSLKVYLKRIK